MSHVAHGASPVARAVIAEARTWIGTPYRHQASRKGIGADCLGLIRGVWRALYGREAEDPGAYAPDWAEAGGADRLLEAAGRYLTRNAGGEIRPGDVLIFRWRPDIPSKHAGIFVGGGRFIHAYCGCGVLSSALVPQWRRRIAGTFSFPEIPGAG